MGNFSYLNLGDHTKARTAGAKPACHGQTGMVSEEYSTAGKLTTAGSLYALYNDHSPDLPMGQLEYTEYKRYAKLPTADESKSPIVETDPRWFGGRGSVRDLAKIFQQHIQQHSAYQSIVDGTVNRNHSYEVRSADNQRSSLFPTPQKTHQLTYDVDDETSSVYTTSSLNDQLDVKQDEESSTESDQISKWVDHEIRKIKRNLSKEIAAKESLRNIELSPDLFDHHDKKSGIMEQVDSLNGSSSNTTQTSQSCSESHQGAGDKEKFAYLNSCYFDDEIYMDEVPVKTNTDYTEKDIPESPVKTSLPMNTVLKETPTKGVKNKDINAIVGKSEEQEPVNKASSGNNKRRASRIPTSRSNIPCKIKSTDAAYANIVTIKSSLDDAGVHQVTHEMKNLKTGGTKTVFNDTVNAKKVITTFRAPR